MRWQIITNLWKWPVFVGLILVLFSWLFSDVNPLRRSACGNIRSANRELDRLTKKLEAEDPVAARELTKLRESREVGELALAAALNASQGHGMVHNNLSNIRSLLADTKTNGGIPAKIKLANLASNPDLFTARCTRADFLQAHASAIQLLQSSGQQTMAQQYVAKLEEASRNPDQWRAVRDDALALIVWDLVDDAQLRSYFMEEKGKGWIEEALTKVTAGVEETAAPYDRENILHSFLSVAREYHPYLKEAIAEHKLDPSVFVLFQDYGDIIKLAVERHALPLKEVLEVVFANQGFLQDQRESRSANESAARLALIHNEKPAVWQAARRSILALKLDQDVPQHSEMLLEKFGNDDIGTFLYGGYEKEIVYAADAVAKFGDLAIFILGKYQESAEFHKALKKPGVGPRLVPYVAHFGDKGLERIDENKKWLDKYFEEDGTPKEKEWWTLLPGGAACDVARNWAKGYPSEWGELGWAALDVADAVLLVASLGASAAATTTVKEGVEIGSKQVGKVVGKGAVRGIDRKVVNEIANEDTKKAFGTARKRAVRLVETKGLRIEAREETASLLSRASKQGVTLGKVIIEPVRRTTRFTIRIGKRTWTAVKKLYSEARTLNARWKGVPVRTRRIVYRSLLAVGLFVTIRHRTIHIPTKLGSAAGKLVKELVNDTKTGLAGGLEEAFKGLIGDDIAGQSRLRQWIVFLVGAVLLGGLVWVLRPFPRRLRHA